MKSGLRILNFLERKYAAVLLTHGLNEPIYITKMRELYRIGSDTFGARRDELIKLNLIVEDREKGFPFRVLYKLTTKGRKVAEHLWAIQRILEEEGD